MGRLETIRTALLDALAGLWDWLAALLFGRPPEPEGPGDEAGAATTEGGGEAAEPEGGEGPTASEWQRALLEDVGILAPEGGAVVPPRTAGAGVRDTAQLEQVQGWGREWLIDGTEVGGFACRSLPGLGAFSTKDAPLREARGRGFYEPVARKCEPVRYPPPEREAWMALIHRLYDAKTMHLLERLTDEQLFAYGAWRWRQVPAAADANREIALAVMRRLSILMGAIYGFEPAEHVLLEPMAPTWRELYDWDTNRYHVHESVLGGTYADMMLLFAHGQTHALQRALIEAHERGRLAGELAPLGRVLAEELRRAPRAPCIGWVRGYQAFAFGYAVGYRARTLQPPL